MNEILFSTSSKQRAACPPYRADSDCPRETLRLTEFNESQILERRSCMQVRRTSLPAVTMFKTSASRPAGEQLYTLSIDLAVVHACVRLLFLSFWIMRVHLRVNRARCPGSGRFSRRAGRYYQQSTAQWWSLVLFSPLLIGSYSQCVHR